MKLVAKAKGEDDEGDGKTEVTWLSGHVALH